MNKHSRLVLKQYGIQRSGTNYLEKLIRLNFGPDQVLFLTNQLQRKHQPCDQAAWAEWLADNPHMSWLHEELENIGLTINVRDPMSWSLGYLKHLKKIRKPIGRPKDPATHVKMIKRLNELYKNWRVHAQAFPNSVAIIRFEDLLQDYRIPLREIAMKFGVTTRDLSLHDVEKEVLSGGRMSNKAYDRRAYYQEKQYLQEMPANVQQAILDTVDWELARFFGYIPEE